MRTTTTRKLAMTRYRTAQLALALAAASVVTACNSIKTTTAGRLAPEPKRIDTFAGTTQPVRNWDRSVATYANGDTASGSTGVRYISDPGQIIGHGGRTTRSDVSAVGGAGGDSVAGAVASGTVGPTGTPAVASGTTDNNQVVRGDGSLAPVGSPGAAGTSGSIAAPAGSVGASVAAQDVGAVDGTAVPTASTVNIETTAAEPLSRTEAAVVTGAVPFVETGVFLANVVTSPITFWQQRDGILSGGYQFPPTHTMMPELPPEPARKPRRVAPAAIAAPATPLTPPSQFPTTNRAATRVTSVFPTTTPVTPILPTTRPAAPTPRS